MADALKMDVREKLVELLKEIVAIQECGFGDPRPTYETVASYLMSHGVTVQEWIPVTERLPDKPMRCLVYTKRGEYGGYEITYYNQGFYTQYAEVTHWMQLPELPQPPKGK